MKKGFTLIELLVVIAIIGILSSVVLASLNSARSKGEDAAKKANLSNIRAQAELAYDTDGDYDGVCTDSNVAEAVSAASATCHDGAAGWAASATLSDSTSFCVDYTGAATTSADIASDDFTCASD